MQQLSDIKDIYKDASEWLKYLEAKNIALTTFLIFLVTMIGEVQWSILTTHVQLRKYILIGLFIALAINIFSYIPFLIRRNWARDLTRQYAGRIRGPESVNNLVFYVHITYLELNHRGSWYEAFKGQSAYEPTPLEKSYIEQVVAVSYTAVLKAMCFEYAITALFFTGASALFLMMINII